MTENPSWRRRIPTSEDDDRCCTDHVRPLARHELKRSALETLIIRRDELTAELRRRGLLTRTEHP